MIRRVTLLFLALLWTATAGHATGFGLLVEAPACGGGAITVEPGCELGYQVIGELGDGASQGLAVVVFDLNYDGGSLPPAGEPAEPPMIAFTAPDGYSANPGGFGGTPTTAGLAQIGGAQNVFSHGAWSCDDDGDCPGDATCDGSTCSSLPNLPIGEVITGVAQPGSPVVLAEGTLTAPFTEGVYLLQVANVHANVLAAGADGDPFWITETAAPLQSTALTITVQSGAACCGTEGSVPGIPAADSRGLLLLIVSIAAAGWLVLARR